MGDPFSLHGITVRNGVEYAPLSPVLLHPGYLATLFVAPGEENPKTRKCPNA